MSKTVRVAGGMGKLAATQDAEALLRRCVMACLLWEDMAYDSGTGNSDSIAELIPQVEPGIVADICIEAREKQKLRHVPLFIAREMARIPAYNKYLDVVLPKIITRADQLTDFVALYFNKTGDRRGQKGAKLTAKVKKGLAAAFENFQEYHFAKYNREGPVRLRDVMFMVHPKPANKEREALYKKIADNTLETPFTWETELSAGKDKCKTFTKLIKENKMGGLAFLRNIRNMEQSGVDFHVVKYGFDKLHNANLLPLNFIGADANSTKYNDLIEKSMLETFCKRPKLTGHTVFVLDVSGSMGAKVSAKSQFDRMDAGIALCILAQESCERCTIYVTAGNWDKHKTEAVRARRGFALRDEIKRLTPKMGGGGIFTVQALEYIKEQHNPGDVDRIIVFSDSQDCDRGTKTPKPFGKTNYIVDVSAHKHGINYKGSWTAEISGWSENFLDYIQAAEGLTLQESEG